MKAGYVYYHPSSDLILLCRGVETIALNPKLVNVDFEWEHDQRIISAGFNLLESWLTGYIELGEL